jgi:hypothetical protein
MTILVISYYICPFQALLGFKKDCNFNIIKFGIRIAS